MTAYRCIVGARSRANSIDFVISAKAGSGNIIPAVIPAKAESGERRAESGDLGPGSETSHHRHSRGVGKCHTAVIPAKAGIQ